MKAIVTRQNPDGSYDEVGMTNRTVIGPFAKLDTTIKHAQQYARKCRIELFYSNNIQQTTADNVLFV